MRGIKEEMREEEGDGKTVVCCRELGKNGTEQTVLAKDKERKKPLVASLQSGVCNSSTGRNQPRIQTPASILFVSLFSSSRRSHRFLSALSTASMALVSSA